MTTHDADCWTLDGHGDCARAEAGRLQELLFAAESLIDGRYGDDEEDWLYKEQIREWKQRVHQGQAHGTNQQKPSARKGSQASCSN
jgi:hypothetical protein